jgi:hypothetical protein
MNIRETDVSWKPTAFERDSIDALRDVRRAVAEPIHQRGKLIQRELLGSRPSKQIGMEDADDPDTSFRESIDR